LVIGVPSSSIIFNFEAMPEISLSNIVCFII
jgi:hypothetical protein